MPIRDAHTRRRLICFLALLASFGLAGQTTSPTQPDFPELLKRLASDNFTTREAAQKELSQLNYKSRPTLVNLAEQSTDPEVKSRLQNRIQQIDEQLALDPPPISLHVKNVDSAALTEALSKALNMPVLINSYSFDPMPTPIYSYTLDADEQPFWDVYAKLSQQSFLHVRIPDEPLALPMFRLRNYQRFGPIIVFQYATSERKQIIFRGPDDVDTPTSTYDVGLMFAADPRMTIASAAQPFLTQIIAKSGNVLARSRIRTEASPQIPRWYETASLSENPGLNLQAVGEIKMSVQVSEVRREIDHPERHLKEPIEMGACLVAIDNVAILRPNDLDSIVLTATARNTNPSTPARLTCAIVDANGKNVASQTGSVGQILLGFNVQAAGKGPFKLLLTTPGKTRELTIPFRLPLVTQ